MSSINHIFLKINSDRAGDFHLGFNVRIAKNTVFSSTDFIILFFIKISKRLLTKKDRYDIILKYMRV